MKPIVIGKNGSIDLSVLIATRLLIQANSGGGKSYLIRRLIEQMFGQIQIIVIDPEGEFATLREKFDFLLVGKDGETPADVRSAGLLATKLLELNASAICDIYEMKAFDRHRWVKSFLDSIMNAPKKLWHPVIIIVDEAHIFCPEKGSGESEASGAMTDLATRGRKRGFCSIFATQRLGKLSKNVTAELQNVLIGSTFQDIDRKRAAETLGIPKTGERAFFDNIKLLEPGNFYGLGRAINRDLTLINVGPVQTSHGDEVKMVPPASAKVKLLMPKFADLPAQAEEKLKTEADLRAEIKDLKAQVKSKVLPPLPPPPEKINVITDADRIHFNKVFDDYVIVMMKLKEALSKVTINKPAPINKVGNLEWVDSKKSRIEFKENPKGNFRVSSPSEKLPIGEEKTLIALIQYPDGLERNQLSVLIGYKRSSRDAYVARLAARGFVNTSGSRLMVTEEGVAALPNYEPLPTGEALQDYWMEKLPAGEKVILQILIQAYPSPVVRDSMDAQYKRSSRDAYIARLASKNLVEESGRGSVIASKNLFE